MTTERAVAKASATTQSDSPWEMALQKLREWDPVWAERCVTVTTNPWNEGILTNKFIELVCLGLSAVGTSLNPGETRRHIRAALAAGASREEVLFVLKVASVMAIHSTMFGVPILLEEASAGLLDEARRRRAKASNESPAATPAVETIKATGQWTEEWDSLLFFAPKWTEQYMSILTELYTKSMLSRKDLELLCVALDVSFMHMQNPGARRHIKNAMKAGATLDEVMEVLKLTVVQGVRACNLGVPILAEELESAATSR